MSRPGPAALAVSLVLTAVAAAPASAQTPAELEARIERLRPLASELRAEVQVLAAAREEAERIAAVTGSRTDTLRVGLALVIAREDQAEVVRTLFAEVWAEHFGGIARSRSLAETVFAFQWGPTDGPLPYRGGPVHRIEPSGWVTRAAVKERIRFGVASVIAADLTRPPSGIGSWINGVPHRAHDLEATYRQLALAASKATRGCLDGDVDSCATALGLGIDGSVIEAWYTPAERRALLAAVPQIWMARTDRDRLRECVDEGSDGACDALLLYTSLRWAPLPGSARESLVGLALEEGGRGAWERLLEDRSMGPEEALAYASGLTLQQLVTVWRARVLEQRPQAQASLRLGGALSLVWALFFAALAMRSTRWRLA